MKLSRVTVEKYRSILQEAKFDIQDFTVLIGPNNQGKSNLLRAIALAMATIGQWVGDKKSYRNSLIHGQSTFSRLNRYRSQVGSRLTIGYRWERDFPKFQDQEPETEDSTTISLVFVSNEGDKQQFWESHSLVLSDEIEFKVVYDSKDVTVGVFFFGAEIDVDTSKKVASFMTERVQLLYIPAVRTGEIAIRIAEEILESKRAALLNSPKYSKLMSQLQELDNTVVTEVEKFLQSTLLRFIPSTESVELQVRELSRGSTIHAIHINDGVNTPIETKGDGIQSLVALAMTLEWSKSSSAPDKHLIIAVEEPESHLHPGAVHELKKILASIAEDQQVVLTTHSQSLVNHTDISSNVIVERRTARKAESLADLRNTLGVRLSDALVSAEVIVIVEGTSDEQIIPVLLAQNDSDLAQWIADGRLVFESVNSGTKIYSRVVNALSILTTPIVVLDGDKAGKYDVKKLTDEELISETRIIQLIRPLHEATELEDLFIISSYIDELSSFLGADLSPREENQLDKGHKAAWSERLAQILKANGTPNYARIVKQAKGIVNATVLAKLEEGEEILREECKPIFERLLGLIRKSLNES